MDKEGQTKANSIKINVGSRNSQLALIQTDIVINQLKHFYDNNPDRLRALYNDHDEVEFSVISMTTTGDQILNKPLPDIGSKSLFTDKLEEALLEQRVDFIVHSLKDLPTLMREGCAIGAVGKRDDPDDAIVLKKSLRSSMKPMDIIFGNDDKDVSTSDDKKLKIGTSSHRRIAMLRHCNQNLECVDIRGNLNTRLAKLDKDESEFGAIILAKAGLNRMKWSDRASEMLTPSTDPRLNDWCYAVGQGALAIECRVNDDRTIGLLSPIVDLKSTYEAIAERSLMRRLEGGCSVPLGVRTTWLQDADNASVMTLDGIVLSLDGQRVVRHKGQTRLDEHEANQPRTKSDIMAKTTGIVLPDRLQNALVIANLYKCAELGVHVANKMIDSGCLELMSCN